MTDYTWFKLLVRAIGLLLMGMGLPYFVSTLVNLVTWALDQGGSQLGYSYVLPYIPSVAGAAAESVFGLYLFLGANGVIARCLRDVRGHCPSCGYDVSAVSTGRCPECGTEFKPPSHNSGSAGASHGETAMDRRA
jgi:hypothetical protein